MSDKLENLKQFTESIKAWNERLTKSDFTAAFSALLKQLLELEKKLMVKITSAVDSLTLLGEKLKSDNSASVSELKGTVGDFIKSSITKIDQKLGTVKDGYTPIKGIDYFDGQDGKPADEVKIVAEVLKQIPYPELEIADIKDLKEELEELKKIRTERRIFGGGFSKLAMDIHIIDGEVIAGSGTSWTLSRIPSPATSLKLYANGQRLTLTTDYTISGLAITTINSFSAGAILADFNI
jgi:hypothetical protein